jgi:transposase
LIYLLGTGTMGLAALTPAERATVMDVPHLVIELRQLRKDVRDGRITSEQLLDIVERQNHTIQQLQAERQQLKQRLAQYEPAAAQPTQTAKPNASYSVDAENQRRQTRRRRPKSPGRRPTKDKFAEAQRYEEIYPQDMAKRECQLLRERAVWRIEDGKAVRVGYRVFAGPDGKEPSIPGVTPRCEYGIEILVVLAFLVYLIGMSLDKACAVLGFFCQLPLAKSQADALLRQLADHWEDEFDLLCALLTQAAIVYMDETGWKIGKEGCSLWAFATDLQRVFLFGCRKDDDTLDAMLPPETFAGIGVSDDAKVYQGRFQQGQKCWAHLLRKAIKLALLYPEECTYQRFLDELLAIYRDGKRSAADGRLAEEGRQRRVQELENRLATLCGPYVLQEQPAPTPPESDLVNLANELVRLAAVQELFTFVLHPEVEATNNRMERELRSPALDRKAGRTNKTASGAHRRSVIVSVLQSLRANLPSFHLKAVLDEVARWMREGASLFAKQWQAIQAAKASSQPAIGTG